MASGEPVVAPLSLDRTALRASGRVPAALRGLVPPARRAAAIADPEAFRRRLLELPEAERLATVAGLVRTHAAVVAGHASPDDLPEGRTFQQLGFDSLAAVELRNGLNAATGDRFPATAVFDHPDPEGLARHLAGRLTAGPPDPGATHRPSDAVAELYRDAVTAGRERDGRDLLLGVARLRPTFGPGADPDAVPKPVVLADGAAGPQIVAVAPMVPLTGNHVYAGFAGSFPGDRRISALTPPGFTGDEHLPATADALVALEADVVRRHVAGASFVLAGVSSGGVLAYEVARHLARHGTPPEAVVLIDTYAMTDPRLELLAEPLGRAMYERAGVLTPVDRHRLSAFAWLCDLFAGWTPEPVVFPVLLVRAGRPLSPDHEGLDWRTSLATATDTVEATGDHFTMMEGDLEATAHLIDEWLTRPGG